MHVNVAQILKFMPNYMFNPAEYPEIGTRDDPADDVVLLGIRVRARRVEGPVRGLGADLREVTWTYQTSPGSTSRSEAFKELLTTAAPDADQQR